VYSEELPHRQDSQGAMARPRGGLRGGKVAAAAAARLIPLDIDSAWRQLGDEKGASPLAFQLTGEMHNIKHTAVLRFASVHVHGSSTNKPIGQ
jgi:hypothetical protein